jgi:threonine/homoserine/homoserine lactone efflux protein
MRIRDCDILRPCKPSSIREGLAFHTEKSFDWRSSMPDLTHWTLFLTATVILLVIPGPSVLFVVARGIDQGFRAALYSSVGLALGDLFQVVCAAVGLSALLASSVALFQVVKFAGAAYLVFLGVRRMLDRSADELPDPAMNQGPGRTTSARSLVAQGFTVNALNPKTALFFLALLPQFVAANAVPASLQILAFGGAFVALGFITNSLYGRLGGQLGAFARRSPRFQKATRYVGGGALVALGLAAALAPSHGAARTK